MDISVNSRADMEYVLHRLLREGSKDVRMALAGMGYGLDVLVNDCNWEVRAEVAKQGYGLDKLLYDRYDGVRMEVARKGYGLDVLAEDSAWGIREIVAQQGYGLDKLINDPCYCVREAVAAEGYGLDILLNDADEDVRYAALRRIRENEHMARVKVWAEQGNRHAQLVLEKEAAVLASRRGDGKVVDYDEARFSDRDLEEILRKVVKVLDKSLLRSWADNDYRLDDTIGDIVARAVRRSEAAQTKPADKSMDFI